MNKNVNRVEVWFNNGEFRAFPGVIGETIKIELGYLSFRFGGEHNHLAIIQMTKVNFIEMMEDEN